MYPQPFVHHIHAAPAHTARSARMENGGPLITRKSQQFFITLHGHTRLEFAAHEIPHGFRLCNGARTAQGGYCGTAIQLM